MCPEGWDWSTKWAWKVDINKVVDEDDTEHVNEGIDQDGMILQCVLVVKLSLVLNSRDQ